MKTAGREMTIGSTWMLLIVLVTNTGWLLEVALAGPAQNYAKALDLSIQFFEAQRSGHLPSSQRASWRADSALTDGQAEGVDLVGGYYDAGDNVKFQFPMAFTITSLAWSVIEYRSQLQEQGQLQHALEAIKWGTDYFIKAHPEPNVLWAQVGDADSDHSCWQRPEDMTTSRKAFKIDASNPGTEVAAETAAAMAASSIAFKDTDRGYSQTLVSHAKQLFNFADKYRGKYDDSVPEVKKFYASLSGYNDELLWAALWMFEATGDEYYLSYVISNSPVFGGIGFTTPQFSWDSKYSGAHVLVSKILFEGRGGPHTSTLRAYQKQAEAFMCSALGKNSVGANIHRTGGGMFWVQAWNNMQFVTAVSFLVTVYSDYMAKSGEPLLCSGQRVQPSELLSTAKGQMDYLLGSNPSGTSYMVGYGNKYPKLVHHRAASIVSFKDDPSLVACTMGYEEWYHRGAENPNVLAGAIVGGPDEDDKYLDTRDNFQGSEAPTYNNGPVVGVLARMASSSFVSSAAGVSAAMKLGAVQQKDTVSDEEFDEDEDEESLDLKLDLDQELVNRWKAGGATYYKYLCTVTNNNNRTVKKLILTFDQIRGPVFGLRPHKAKDNSFTFPMSRRSLPPGKTLKFMYIFYQSRAEITIKQVLLV